MPSVVSLSSGRRGTGVPPVKNHRQIEQIDWHRRFRCGALGCTSGILPAVSGASCPRYRGRDALGTAAGTAALPLGYPLKRSHTHVKGRLYIPGAVGIYCYDFREVAGKWGAAKAPPARRHL